MIFFQVLISMFFEAQRRFRNGQLFSGDGYVKEKMKLYGNNGYPVKLPTMNDDKLTRAMQFREREKQNYTNMQNSLRSTQEELNALRAERDELSDILDRLAFISSSYAHNDANGPDSHTTDPRRSDAFQVNDTCKEAVEKTEVSSSSGGALPDSADRAESNVDRPAGEHSTEE